MASDTADVAPGVPSNVGPSSHGLPRPSLIYDADCGFCTVSARWLERRFATRDAVVVPWQRTPLDDIGLTVADVTEAAWWVEPSGPRQRGHLAIAASLKACSQPWPVIGRLIAAPGISTVGRWVYAFVARHRDRMPGGTDSCRM